MEAVLYVAHGSRMKAGVEEAERFVTRLMNNVNVLIQELCFLELASPNLMQGIERCIQRGATSIAVMPLLLLTAVHAKVDIPNEMGKARLRFPNVKLSYGRTLGVHPDIVAALFDRIITQQTVLSSDAKVIIVGRGSSDPDVKKDLTEIARMLQKHYPFQAVDVCFLYGAKPSFSDTMIALETERVKQVYIVPYLLFTGLLLTGIEERIAAHRRIRNDQHVILCEALGYHQAIKSVAIERVNEVLLK